MQIQGQALKNKECRSGWWRRRLSQERENQGRGCGKRNAYEFPLVAAAEGPVRFPGCMAKYSRQWEEGGCITSGFGTGAQLWVLCSSWVSTFHKVQRKLAKCCRRDTRMVRVWRNCPVELVRVVSFHL